jgi:hypothetical protein
VVDVVVEEVVEVVVDDVVEVDAAVVAGVVVDVVSAGSEEVLSSATEEDVDAESVVAALSLLQPAIVSAMRMRGRRRVDFTEGSLARTLPFT